MPLTPKPAYPVAQWDEPPITAAAFSIEPLTPYLLTDGSVEFLARTDSIPVGAIEASVVDAGGFDEIVTPAVSTGRRTVERAGAVFLI